MLKTEICLLLEKQEVYTNRGRIALKPVFGLALGLKVFCNLKTIGHKRPP